MGIYKDKGGCRYVSIRYKNRRGESSRKTRRGFENLHVILHSNNIENGKTLRKSCNPLFYQWFAAFLKVIK